MEIVSFLNRFTPRQRISAMLIIGAVLAVALYYNSPTEVAVAPPLPVKQTVPGTVQPQLPQGAQSGQVVRDPFAVPAEFAPAKPVALNTGLDAVRTGSSNLPINAGMPQSQSQPQSPPILTGIVGGEGRWAAILKYGGSSRSYQLRDSVGPYQVVAITANSATISGPGGSVVLKVSAPQQTALKSEVPADQKGSSTSKVREGEKR